MCFSSPLTLAKMIGENIITTWSSLSSRQSGNIYRPFSLPLSYIAWSYLCSCFHWAEYLFLSFVRVPHILGTLACQSRKLQIFFSSMFLHFNILESNELVFPLTDSRFARLYKCLFPFPHLEGMQIF